MRSRSNLKVSLAVFGLILSIRAIATGADTMVYYVPFRIETFVAITRATIESSAGAKWVISDPSRVKSLVALLNGGVRVKSDKFDENRVRAKIYSVARSIL
jgi:hypothetical protein